MRTVDDIFARLHTLQGRLNKFTPKRFSASSNYVSGITMSIGDYVTDLYLPIDRRFFNVSDRLYALIVHKASGFDDELYVTLRHVGLGVEASFVASLTYD